MPARRIETTQATERDRMRFQCPQIYRKGNIEALVPLQVGHCGYIDLGIGSEEVDWLAKAQKKIYKDITEL